MGFQKGLGVGLIKVECSDELGMKHIVWYCYQWLGVIALDGLF